MLKRIYTIISLIAVIFWLSSCGGASKSDMTSIDGGEYMEKTAINDGTTQQDYEPSKTESEEKIIAPIIPDNEQTVIEKKIIKTADIRFGVSDYKKSRSQIEKLVKKHKGFISQENESNSTSGIANSLIIRVPAQNFDSLLNALEGEADRFESKSINLSDVTEEFIDIEKRLENKKKVEAQYLEILKKAYTIHDILEVNEHIRVIREEIEAKEGRLKYLNNQVGLSTITLYVHQDFDTVSYGFFHKIAEALAGGWNGFLAFLVGLVYIWPLVIISAVIAYAIRRSIVKRRNKKAGNVS